jgi:hypothetical protein
MMFIGENSNQGTQPFCFGCKKVIRLGFYSLNMLLPEVIQIDNWDLQHLLTMQKKLG